MTTEVERAVRRAASRPRARATDPATSHEAARRCRADSRAHLAVLGVVRVLGPLTDEELVATYERTRTSLGNPELSPSGIRTRRSELAAAGVVHEHDREGRTSRGRRAARWSA